VENSPQFRTAALFALRFFGFDKFSAEASMAAKRIYFRFSNNGLLPADSWAASQLQEKRFHNGDIVAAQLWKLNNPGFHRLIHRIGQLCASNIEAFEGMDAHRVIKRIQLEGNICCEEIAGVLPGTGAVTWRIPQSISFDSMDDSERHELAISMCRHVAARYWNTLTAEQIEQMAESFVND